MRVIGKNNGRQSHVNWLSERRLNGKEKKEYRLGHNPATYVII